MQLSLEIGLFSNRLSLVNNGSFLSNDFFLDDFFHSFFSGGFVSDVLFVAGALAAAGAFAAALTLTGVVAAGAGCQQILGPLDDLLAISSDDIDGADNGSQSGQNLHCGFHRQNLHQIMISTISITNGKGKYKHFS
jgi:hypothetical protein